MASLLALGWSTTGMTIAVVPREACGQRSQGAGERARHLSGHLRGLPLPACRTADEERGVPSPLARAGAGGLPDPASGRSSGTTRAVLIGTAVSSAASYGFTYLRGAIRGWKPARRRYRERATAGLFVYAYVWILGSRYRKRVARGLVRFGLCAGGPSAPRSFVGRDLTSWRLGRRGAAIEVQGGERGARRKNRDT